MKKNEKKGNWGNNMPEKTAVKSKWADSRKDCPGSIQVWSHHLSPGILDAWTGVVEVWEQILVSQSFSKLRHIFFRTTDNDENWISTGDKIEQYEDGDKRAHARISPFNLCIKGLWPFSSWKDFLHLGRTLAGEGKHFRVFRMRRAPANAVPM